MQSWTILDIFSNIVKMIKMCHDYHQPATDQHSSVQVAQFWYEDAPRFSNISQWLAAVSLPSCRCGLRFDYTATTPLPGSNRTWTSSLFPVCNFRWTGGSVSHRHGLTLQPQICHHCACRCPSSFAYHSLISHNSACKDWHVPLSIEDVMLVVRWLWQFFFQIS